ncbi:phage/plasmid primase, P4 family [Streptomyces sp. NPDC007063]|uniref:phage/plasmid primase, P4 family n=1 Tax=Streptomyces sp. NPDC007063 TaxID=3364772 RepID=UPI00368C7DCD
MELQSILDTFGEYEEDHEGFLLHCPAHDDSTKSLKFMIGDDGKGRLVCRAGCDNSAVVKASGLKWPDFFGITGAHTTVPKETPSPVSGKPVTRLALYIDACSEVYLTSEAEEYAEHRFGVTREQAARLELGFADRGFAHTSRAFDKHPRLVVPFKDFAGKPHGMQGRDLSGQCPARWVGLMNPEGMAWGRYAYMRSGPSPTDVVIVSEGPGDGLTAVGAGYDAVAIRGAALASVSGLAEALAGRFVVVAGDRDSAGQAFNAKVVALLAPHGVDAAPLPIPDLGPKADLSDWREHAGARFPNELSRAVEDLRSTYNRSEVIPTSTDVDDRTGTDVVTTEHGTRALALITEFVARYGESDAANAHALVAFTEGRIRYAAGLGFFVWDGRVWERSHTRVRQEIHRMAAAMVLAGGLAQSKGFTYTNRIDALMTELKSVPAVHVQPDDFDARHELLSFRNGVVNLRTGKLQPHDKRNMLTVSLPVDYDASAECPRWEQFLSEVMPGMPDMPGYLRRLVGYGITGNTNEQCFAVLHGKGANGKSVFTETLTDVFTAITKTTPFSTFETKPSGGISNDVAALKGARIVMASEGERDKPMSEALLKRATGKDKITARFMRAEYFTFEPTFLIILGTNHKPNFRSQDEGLWRRVKLIPWVRYFAPHERDYGLEDYLKTRERAGIIAWAVRGAMEWYQGGLRDPDEIQRATADFRESSNPLDGFVPGTYEITKDVGDSVKGAELYLAYKDWCEAEGLQMRDVWKRNSLYRAVEDLGAQKKKTRVGIEIFGVKKVDTPDQHPDTDEMFKQK